MRSHLYTLKKPCQGIKQVIDLTEEMKEHILANRFWHPPPQEQPPPQVNYNTIHNNYNTMNNIVSRIDDVDKLVKALDYHGATLTNFSQGVEDMYANRCESMDAMRSKNVFLDTHVLYETIDGATSTKELNKVNILYEDVAQKLKIYDDNEWRTVLFDIGVNEVLTMIKDAYLDVYERYLIRLYQDASTGLQKKAAIKEKISEYYMFIACFDLQPYVQGRSDSDILYQDCDDVEGSGAFETIESFDLSDIWYPLYKRTKENLGPPYINKVKRDVSNIVKRNAKANSIELNKQVLSLIHMDEDFKTNVLQGLL
jgi:hypothetical protein